MNPLATLSKNIACWRGVNPGVSAALANSGWLMLERITRMVLAVLVGAWIARHLGPQQYGVLAYVIAIVMVWQTISSLGLESIVVRDLSHDQESGGSEAGFILGTAFCLRLVAAVLCWLGVVFTVSFLRGSADDVTLKIALILGAAILFQTADLVDHWFQSKLQSVHAVVPRVTAVLAASSLKVWMIVADAPLWAFSLAFLFEAGVTAVFLVWAYRRSGMRLQWVFQRRMALRLLRNAWPLLLTNILFVVYMRIDLLMLSELAGDAQAGLYAAILPLSSAFHMVAATLCASALPGLTTLRRSSPELYVRRLRQLLIAMLAAGLVVATVTAIAAPWVVGILLGTTYQDAVAVLRWHALVNIFTFSGSALGLIFIIENKQRLSLLGPLLGVAVSVCANYYLLPSWGAVGASLVAVLSQLFAVMLNNIFLIRYYWRALP